MNRFQTAASLLMLVAASAVMAQKSQPTSRTIKGEDVKFTTDPDDVEFCKTLGEVGGGFRRTDKAAAALGANVVLQTIYTSGGEQYVANGGTAYFCGADDTAKQAEKRAALQKSADRKISCTAGLHCEFEWSRVTAWLLENSKWKLRNVTDALITTEGPMDTGNPSFEVIKMATGDGKTYQILMRASCGIGQCTERALLRLKAKFVDFVLAPPTQ